MSGGIDISVVVPVYNSARILPTLLDRLHTELPHCASSFEIILVDDDSPDDSWAVIEGVVARYPAVRAIQLMRNAGQVAATLCGMSMARGDIVVTMDDDLQHPPDQVPVLVAGLCNAPGLDAVFGRFPRRAQAMYRRLGSWLIGRIHAEAFRLPPGLQPSSFRALRRPLVDAVLRHGTRSPSLTALMCASTRRLGNVDVRHDPRPAGRSNYSLARQFRLAFDNLCSSSTLPLRLVSWLGLCLCAASALSVGVQLWKYVQHRITVPGWTTLAVLQGFYAGAILLSLGVFGEYMIRILREVRGAPRHIERRRLPARDPGPHTPPGKSS